DEQLAGHRQLLRKRQRGALDPLRRPRRRDLLRHGEARAGAADRARATVLTKRSGKNRAKGDAIEKSSSRPSRDHGCAGRSAASTPLACPGATSAGPETTGGQ